MSVEVKDFRKYKESLAKENAKTPKIEDAPPLPQVAVENTMETGHPDFDKLIRVLKAKGEEVDQVACNAALACAGAFQDHLIRVKQFEFMYNKGKLDAFKEAAMIPAQILAEKKSS